MTLGGFPAFGTRWWSIEDQYVTQGSRPRVVTLRDALTRTEVQRWILDDNDPVFSGAYLSAQVFSFDPYFTIASQLSAASASSQDMLIELQFPSFRSTDGSLLFPGTFHKFTADGSHTITPVTSVTEVAIDCFGHTCQDTTGEECNPPFNPLGGGAQGNTLWDYKRIHRTSVNAVSWHNAPKAAGSESIAYYGGGCGNSIITNGFGLPLPSIEVEHMARLYIGDLNVGADGKATVSDDEEVIKIVKRRRIGELSNDPNVITYGSYMGGIPHLTWVYFDSSPTHWVGVVYKEIESYAICGLNGCGTPLDCGEKSYQLYIDGALVQEIKINDSTVGSIGQIFWGEPYVCHPHETLGDGWIAVPTKIYLEYPSDTHSGILADPSNPWRIIIYKDGQIAWEMPPDPKLVGLMPRIVQSSDRWLYVGGDPTRGMGDAEIDHYRHDGALSFRTGQLQSDCTIVPDPHLLPTMFRPKGWIQVTKQTAVVQNSNDIPLTIPAIVPPGACTDPATIVAPAPPVYPPVQQPLAPCGTSGGGGGGGGGTGDCVNLTYCAPIGKLHLDLENLKNCNADETWGTNHWLLSNLNGSYTCTYVNEFPICDISDFRSSVVVFRILLGDSISRPPVYSDAGKLIRVAENVNDPNLREEEWCVAIWAGLKCNSDGKAWIARIYLDTRQWYGPSGDWPNNAQWGVGCLGALTDTSFGGTITTQPVSDLCRIPQVMQSDFPSNQLSDCQNITDFFSAFGTVTPT
jgi:hypothetical protein